MFQTQSNIPQYSHKHMNPAKPTFLERIATFNTRIIMHSTMHPILFLILFSLSILNLQLIITQTPITPLIIAESQKQPQQSLHDQYIQLDKYYTQMNEVFRWFDFSIFFQKQQPLFYVILVFIWSNVLCNLIMIVVNLRAKSLDVSVQTHYLIKISIAWSYIMSYGILTTISRNCLSLICSPTTSVGLKVGCGLTLSAFIVFLYSLPLFGINHITWKSERIYSSFSYPNAIFIYNCWRLIITLVSIIIDIKYREQILDLSQLGQRMPVIKFIMTILFYLSCIFFLMRSTIISPKHNSILQVLIGISLFLTFIRICEIIYEITFYPLIVIPTGFIFTLGLKWVLDKKLSYQVLSTNQDPHSFIPKVKILCYLIDNLTSHTNSQPRKLLNSFLIDHCHQCQLATCNCRKLLDFIVNPLSSQCNQICNQIVEKKANQNNTFCFQKNQTELKISKITSSSYQQNNKLNTQNISIAIKKSEINKQKNYDNFHQEQNLWYQFIYSNILTQFNNLHLDQLTNKDRAAQIHKMKAVAVDQSYIMIEAMNKRYPSLHNIQRVNKLVKELNIGSIEFYTNYNILKHQLTKKMSNHAQQISIIKYGKRYIDFQTSLINFRKLIHKAIEINIQFWCELKTENPDQQMVIHLVETCNQLMIKIRSTYKSLSRQYSTNTIHEQAKLKNEYESDWNEKAMEVINQFYIPFTMIFDSLPDQGNQKNSKIHNFPKLSHNKNKKQDKLLDIYYSDSNAMMSLVSLNEGEFGKILLANKQFRSNLLVKNQTDLYITHFLPEAYQSRHEALMKGLLESDKVLFPGISSFLKISHTNYLEVKMDGFLYPDVSKGIKFAMILEKSHNHPYSFLMIKEKGMIGYTQDFEYNTDFTVDTLQSLKNQVFLGEKFYNMGYKDSQFFIVNDQDVEISFFHVIETDSEKIQVFQLRHLGEEDLNKVVQSNQLNHNIFQMMTRAIIEKEKPQQSEAQLHQISEIKKINENNHSPKSINFWYSLILLLFVIIILITIGIVFAASHRRSLYYTLYNENLNCSKMTNTLLDISFGIRRLNVIGYEKTMGYSQQVRVNREPGDDDQLIKFSIYKEMLQLEISQLKQLQNYLGFDWEQEVEGFDFTNYKKQLKQLTYFVFLNQYLLGSATFLRTRDIKQMSFDYLYQQVQSPLPSETIKLYNNLFNTYKVVVPALEKYQIHELKRKLNKQLFEFRCNPVMIMGLIILIISLGICLYTIYINRRFSRILYICYKMLENLKLTLINHRISAFSDYSQYFMIEYVNGDKIVINQEDEIKNSSRNRMIRLSTKFESLLIENSSRQMGDQTNRLSFLEQIINKSNSKENNKLKITQQSHCSQYLQVKMLIFPIFILVISLVLSQILYNQKVDRILNISRPIELRLSKILMIRNLMYETVLAYQNMSDPYPSFMEQTDTTINDIYQLNAQIPEKLIEESAPETYKRFKKIKNSQYCQIPKITDQLPTPHNVFSECTSYMLINFNGKTTDQLFVFFVEQARAPAKYFNQSSNDPDYRRQFINSLVPIDKFFFEITSHYYRRVFNYFRQGIQIDLDNVSEQYFTSILIILLILMTTTIIVGVICFRSLRENLYRQTSLIKNLYRMISYGAIQFDEDLKKNLGVYYKELKYLE